jgi:hypothetical protein
MSGYGPVRHVKPPKTVKKPYELDYDEIINSIIDLKSDDAVRAKALKYKREKYDTFIQQYSGLPTKMYKKLLIRILERFTTFTREQLKRISVWLFLWEEESLTGIMKVMPTDAIYGSYVEILKAIFGDPIPFQNQNGDLDLANSTIVLAINESMKPCPYGNHCYRIVKNKLHAKWRHPHANASAAASVASSVAAANAPANAAASAQGGKRRKRKTQKKSRKQRS